MPHIRHADSLVLLALLVLREAKLADAVLFLERCSSHFRRWEISVAIERSWNCCVKSQWLLAEDGNECDLIEF